MNNKQPNPQKQHSSRPERQSGSCWPTSQKSTAIYSLQNEFMKLPELADKFYCHESCVEDVATNREGARARLR